MEATRSSADVRIDAPLSHQLDALLTVEIHHHNAGQLPGYQAPSLWLETLIPLAELFDRREPLLKFLPFDARPLAVAGRRKHGPAAFHQNLGRPIVEASTHVRRRDQRADLLRFWQIR